MREHARQVIANHGGEHRIAEVAEVGKETQRTATATACVPFVNRVVTPLGSSLRFSAHSAIFATNACN